MAKTKIEELAINYTARNFSSIKDELTSYAKRYYPDTFKDFSEASFGALMLDMVAYVGDIMSFYVDYQANESFLQTAIEYDNIIKLSRQLGYRYNAAPTSHGVVTLYVLVPVATTGGGPDPRYMPVLKRGTNFTSTSGNSFILVEDVDFSSSSNMVVVGRVNPDTGAPITYAIKASGRVISGAFQRAQYEIDGFQRFRKIEIPGGPSVAEITSVFDSNGNQYFEVDYLSQDVVYREIFNPDASQRTLAPNIMKPVVVPRRFIIERSSAQTLMIFGHGSENDISTDPISEPNRTILNLHGKDYNTDQSFDPTNLISSDKLGVGPANTTLTVLYRSNSIANVNAPVGTVTQTADSVFVFENEFDLSSTKVAEVKRSLEVINQNPIIGDLTSETVDEVRQKSYGVFYSQNRAVTSQDYKSMVYSMPPKFGAIARCAIHKDGDSFKRNLNLYILCKNSNNNLVRANMSIKQNLKNWINKYRMINDSIDILDAKIINLGIKFEILSEKNINKAAVLNNCLIALNNKFLNKQPDIGEFLEITKIYKLLNSVRGVADTVNVEVYQKNGTNYADSVYNIDAMMSADRRYLTFPFDTAYEFKYGTDFEGVVQ
jgi:hypothetical protein